MTYDDDFYRSIENDSASSAEVIAQEVWEIFQPESVLDIGCGTGAFCAEFNKLGCEVYGVDSSIAPNLMIPTDKFQQVDISEPFDVGTSDLVVCLEVAEHIPQPKTSNLIENIVKHGNVALFSAAIPFQGGEGHVNEQWPDYWAWMFNQHDWVGSGALRFDIWGKSEVSYWYQQNIFIYAHKNDAPEEVLDWIDKTPGFMNWRFVHPTLFGNKMGVTFL